MLYLSHETKNKGRNKIMIICAKHLITGDGKTVLEDKAVAVENGTIRKIGPKEALIAEFPEKK